MSAPTRAAEMLFPGTSLRVQPLEDTEEIVQLVTQDSGSTYIMKCFGADQHALVKSEVALRQVLSAFTDIVYPQILEIAELGDERYVLMEHIDGERLDHRWHNQPALIPEEMARLGTMMGAIHAIPLEDAQQFLDEDPSIYTEDYFSQMSTAIAPFLNTDEQVILQRCYRDVNDATVEQTVLHGDFAPLQVIVRPDGQWVFFDFEFGMTGPFADDLGGAEVRMERLGFSETELFLNAYEQVQPRLDAYRPLRSAFKTYVLLVIISASITRDEETPRPQDLEQLRALLDGYS